MNSLSENGTHPKDGCFFRIGKFGKNEGSFLFLRKRELKDDKLVCVPNETGLPLLCSRDGLRK